MDTENLQSETDEEMLEKIANQGIMNVRKSFKEIHFVWNTFGIGSSEKVQRAKACWTHIESLLKDIFEEEITYYNETKERIENYKVKIEKLSIALAVTPKNLNEKSLIKQEELLRQELDVLTKLKQNKLKMYQDLKNVELRYCQTLNTPEYQLPPNTDIPSDKDLEKLQHRIGVLEKETETRQRKLYMARKELATIRKATELIPETTLEKNFSPGEETFSLSNETLETLEKIVSNARKRKMELETEKNGLVRKLQTLWVRLKLDESEQVEFLANHAGHSLSTIKIIKDKIEKVKKDNVKVLIDLLRPELVDLWDKCHVSKSIRRQFQCFTSTDATPEILAAHEDELEKWQSYYAETQLILGKIEKRKVLWELMIALENKATDPNRFKNRKGCLLKDEKERKKLQKDLPDLENAIFQDIEAYEAEKGSPFLYYDEDYRQFVRNQWTEWNRQKENGKLERVKSKMGIVTGTPAKRPVTAIPSTAPSKLYRARTSVTVPNSCSSSFQNI